MCLYIILMSSEKNKIHYLIYYQKEKLNKGILENFIKYNLIKSENTIKFFGILGFKNLCNIDIRFKIIVHLFIVKSFFKFILEINMHCLILLNTILKLLSFLRKYLDLEYIIYFLQFFFYKFNASFIIPLATSYLFIYHYNMLLFFPLKHKINSYFADIIFMTFRFKSLMLYYKFFNLLKTGFFTASFFYFLRSIIKNLTNKKNNCYNIKYLFNYFIIVLLKEIFVINSIKMIVTRRVLLQISIMFNKYNKKTLVDRKNILLLNLYFYTTYKNDQKIKKKYKKSQFFISQLRNFAKYLLFKKFHFNRNLTLFVVENFTVFSIYYGLKLQKYDTLVSFIVYDLFYSHKIKKWRENKLFLTTYNNSYINFYKKMKFLNLIKKYYKILYLNKYSNNYIIKLRHLKYINIYEKNISFFKYLLLYKKKNLFYINNLLSRFEAIL
uniref:Uncharacterized protein n=1 Tax=Lotharella vacuolata TaxID=74820 RepID=A0A0H5BHP9_9EUKA|nr:hypothetical protein [Lotharella vacuolata]